VLEPTLALMALHTVEIAGVSAGGSTRGRHAGRSAFDGLRWPAGV